MDKSLNDLKSKRREMNRKFKVAEQRLAGSGLDLTAAEQDDVLASLKTGPASRLMGVSTRSLLDWKAPRNEDGTYSAFTLVPWLLERKMSGVSAKERNEPLDRIRNAQAEMAEMKLAEFKQLVIPAEVVDQIFEHTAMHLHKAAEIIRRVNEDCYEVLARSLDEARQEFHDRCNRKNPDVEIG